MANNPETVAMMAKADAQERVNMRMRISDLEAALSQAVTVLRKHQGGRFHNLTTKAITHAEQLLGVS